MAPHAIASQRSPTFGDRADLLQPVFLPRAQLDRTVLQQDQAMSAYRDPI
jgi:hypothetical protein